ncbi:hypothetical protein [Microbacterium testaceum]|uniref:hypothetical protein n=1 Tax=Microbacterium testaceum TaxID=2033 RepID=UPI0015E19734|nr:hypothetical protein [Microbacterium testaceum]
MTGDVALTRHGVAASSALYPISWQTNVHVGSMDVTDQHFTAHRGRVGPCAVA